MENFYEELYQYLIERGIDDDEATEVVNYLYEDNIHEYELLTENRGRAFLNMLRAVGYMSGVLKKPGARQAVKRVIPKVQQGTPLQGKLLTKTGKAQNFTGGRTPFTGTDPVPAASSRLPQPAAPASQAPGQMRIPGLSSRAQELRNVTGNPNLGLPGNKGGGLAVTGGSNATRNKSIFKAQPTRTAPEASSTSSNTCCSKIKEKLLSQLELLVLLDWHLVVVKVLRNRKTHVDLMVPCHHILHQDLLQIQNLPKRHQRRQQIVLL